MCLLTFVIGEVLVLALEEEGPEIHIGYLQAWVFRFGRHSQTSSSWKLLKVITADVQAQERRNSQVVIRPRRLEPSRSSNDRTIPLRSNKVDWGSPQTAEALSTFGKAWNGARGHRQATMIATSLAAIAMNFEGEHG